MNITQKHNQSQRGYKDIILSVKYKSTNKSKDQLIMIETMRSNQSVSVDFVIRKLSQLDSLIEHMSDMYGSHIIPALKFQQIMQPKLAIDESMLKIQGYLNDLKQNKYCNRDSQYFSFIFDQTISFPQRKSYDKMLKKATKFSRQYLNTMFTRKLIIETQNSTQYIGSYQVLLEAKNNYNPIRDLALSKIQQLNCYLELIISFVQVGSISCNAIHPMQQEIQEIEKSILLIDKLITQAQDAHSRWSTLSDNVREVQGYLYKGLHQFTNQYDRLHTKLKLYNSCLSKQFANLSELIQRKMQIIVKFTSLLVQNTIHESLFPYSQSINNEQMTKQQIIIPQKYKQSNIDIHEIDEARQQNYRELKREE